MDQNTVFQDSFLNSKYFNPVYLFEQGIYFIKQAFYFIASHWSETISVFNTFLFFLAIFFTTLIFYTIIRLFEIRKKENTHLQHEIVEYAHHHAEKEKRLDERQAISRNPRWVQTLDYLLSPNAGDWKLAIIEADSMLEELLEQLGFKGETLGERLKSVTQDKFKNLTLAWEVHTIRNRIAHEGVNFEVSAREAKRVIAIYEQIFREYGFI